MWGSCIFVLRVSSHAYVMFCFSSIVSCRRHCWFDSLDRFYLLSFFNLNRRGWGWFKRFPSKLFVIVNVCQGYNFCSIVENCLSTVPNARIITSFTLMFTLNNLPISLAKSWYFPIFLLPLFSVSHLRSSYIDQLTCSCLFVYHLTTIFSFLVWITWSVLL